MRRSLLLASMLLCILPANAQLQVRYAAKSLLVSGASPNGDVAVYGVSHVNYRGHEAMTTQTSIERADRDGTVTLQPAQLSFRSVWLFVDLRSGEYAVSTPPGYHPRQLDVPSDGIDRFGRFVSQNGPTADIFVARHGLGAWHGTVSQGSAENADARKSHVGLSLDHFKPVGATPAAPALLAKGDVVMVFDLGFMQFWVTQVTAANISGVNDAH